MGSKSKKLLKAGRAKAINRNVGPVYKEAHSSLIDFGLSFFPKVFRVFSKPFVNEVGKTMEVLGDEDRTIKGLLSSQSTLINKVLMSEASRYYVSYSRAFFSLGLWVVFSSTPFLGPVEPLGVRKGGSDVVDGFKGTIVDYDPLRVI